MPNYRIIGADQAEYGPVSAEQIRQWMADRRVDSETKLQVEGSGEWKRLAEVPVFAASAVSLEPDFRPSSSSPTFPNDDVSFC